MLLVSDTESQASLFLGNFKQQLLDNQELIDLFELRRDEKGKIVKQNDHIMDAMRYMVRSGLTLSQHKAETVAKSFRITHFSPVNSWMGA